MLPDQRRQRPEVGFGQSSLPIRLSQHLLQHERIHVHHAVLQQMQRQHADLVIFAAVACHLAAARKEDEVVGAVPSFDGVEARVDLAAQRQAVQVAGEEDRLHRSAEFGECFVGRVLHIVAGEAAQDRLGVGGAETQGRRVFHHLVVLLADQLPINGLGQNRPQAGKGVRLPGVGPVQLLAADRLEPRQQLEAKQPAEGEADRALAVAVHVLAVNLHLRAVVQDPFDHRGDLR